MDPAHTLTPQNRFEKIDCILQHQQGRQDELCDQVQQLSNAVQQLVAQFSTLTAAPAPPPENQPLPPILVPAMAGMSIGGNGWF